ncbi:MAG: general stress protein [Mycobacterium sp.]
MSDTVRDATGNPDTDAKTFERRRLLASFEAYADAQELVDRMSDGGFPVEHVSIVGDGVRTVEHVTGRMTKAKAALAGAATGAWLGVFIGLLFLLFTVGPFWQWIWVLLIPILIGALFGAAFGFIAHWSTRGRRDFSSVHTLTAARYDVFVSAEHVDEAARFVRRA